MPADSGEADVADTTLRLWADIKLLPDFLAEVFVTGVGKFCDAESCHAASPSRKVREAVKSQSASNGDAGDRRSSVAKRPRWSAPAARGFDRILGAPQHCQARQFLQEALRRRPTVLIP